MKMIISEYITSIRKNGENFEFFGDGDGDFEEKSTGANDLVIVDYIKFCYDQIKIAGEYLKKNKK
jgi:hypothetical protein